MTHPPVTVADECVRNYDSKLMSRECCGVEFMACQLIGFKVCPLAVILVWTVSNTLNSLLAYVQVVLRFRWFKWAA